MDLRLKTEKFEFRGKTYQLRCNMNVLAEAQEAVGGDIMTALRSPATLKTGLLFLSAMMNDYAEEQGWPERFTPSEVGRTAEPVQMMTFLPRVMELTVSALTGGGEDGEDDPLKNPETREAEDAAGSTSPGI